MKALVQDQLKWKRFEKSRRDSYHQPLNFYSEGAAVVVRRRRKIRRTRTRIRRNRKTRTRTRRTRIIIIKIRTRKAKRFRIYSRSVAWELIPLIDI